VIARRPLAVRLGVTISSDLIIAALVGPAQNGALLVLLQRPPGSRLCPRPKWPARNADLLLDSGSGTGLDPACDTRM
jgi:hypothetical protein